MTRVPWREAEVAELVRRYPHEPTAAIAANIGHSLSSVNNLAGKLGIKKSAAYMQSPAACRLRRGDNVGKAYRYPPGHVPANKGLRRPGWSPGRMRETQFRKGERRGVAVTLYQPIGAERLSKEGYLQRKVNDDLPLQARWRGVHILVWEAANGPVPKGHAVAFLNGDKKDIRLANLELITRAQLMARNTVHNLPKPLASAIQLLGALKRQIRKKTKAHDTEQDRTPAQPPVRDARGAEGRREADGSRPGASDR